jgi:DNA polymerase-4/DNA polymerase V
MQSFTLASFPRAILHIDGDAFFAACEQSRDPSLAGRPVVTGGERGIAASMSYEAKARGITRGMRIRDMRRVCPEVIILPSDYETYSLLSQRFYDIVRRWTSEVEEYGIDECFADLTGMRRAHRASYPEIAARIKEELARELGFTFSLGLAANKVVAKIASKWNKPDGLTVIPAREIHHYTRNLPVEKVWGIGPNTAAFLYKSGIRTALDFTCREEPWVRANLSKPFFEIWQELRGISVLPLLTQAKQSYGTIQKVKTFTPASCDRGFIFAQLCKNIENATIKARRYKLAAKRAVFFLRTQTFYDRGMEVKFSHPTAFPHEIIAAIEPHFDKLLQKNTLYRSTGLVLLDLTDATIRQQDLFGVTARVEKIGRVYEAIDRLRAYYGKHTAFIGSSFFAHQSAQHTGDRGKTPERKNTLLKGETGRRRLSIPMFMGKID